MALDLSNVDVRVDIGVVNLPAVLNARYGNDIALAPLQNPATPAVGEVWVATQFETTSGKTKPERLRGQRRQLAGDPQGRLAVNQHEQPPQHVDDRNQNLIY